MKVGAREIGPNAPVFIIAEIGSNHGGSLDRALALIDAAADAGADAAKFQRYRVDNFLVPRPDPEALRRYELPDEWLPKLKARCDERGIEFLCTAFDFDGIGVIAPFVNAFKVGSYENTRIDFLRAHRSGLYRWNKPLIVSNGIVPVPDWVDVEMECVSQYPAAVDGYLRGADSPRASTWSPLWGVSDHTLHPTIVPAAATALGACVVEKHMRGRADVKRYGVNPQWSLSPDYAVSINDDQFAEMVSAVRLTEKAVRG